MKNTYQAGIFDLEGVIARTTRQQQKAWRTLFDEYRQWLRRKGRPTFEPYQEADYRRYIEGRSRLDGLRNFLQSRGVGLAEGTPNDTLEKDTIHGLGNRKNELFRQLLQDEGVDLYLDSVEQIRRWHGAGLRTAVISASKNCRDVLEAAGLGDLFDVCVDGHVMEQEDLAPRPAPDMAAAALSRLGVEAGDTFLVEATLPGIRAARAAGFGLVVGVARNADEGELRQAGADVVVGRLGQLDLGHHKLSRAEDLPHALAHTEAIARRLITHPPLLFLDFDGTLTPIIEDRHQAFIDPDIQQLLQQLALHLRLVAVVTGRDLLDVRRRVNLDRLYYLGSHGFELSGPSGLTRQQPDALAMLPQMEAAEHQAREALAQLQGADVERKRFAIALHYRQAGPEASQKLKEAVRRIVHDSPDLRRSTGKCVEEIRPDIEWDKGKALTWLIRELGLRESAFTPVYIGDDHTDEDAYREIRDRGIAIQVGDHGAPTQARYRLEDVGEVRQFLEWLLEVVTTK